MRNNANGQDRGGSTRIELYSDGGAKYLVLSNDIWTETMNEYATYTITDVRNGVGTITFNGATWKNIDGVVAVDSDGVPYQIAFEWCFGYDQEVEFNKIDV